eukprot:6191603-Pleurochrysis_carterae.AAC.1
MNIGRRAARAQGLGRACAMVRGEGAHWAAAAMRERYPRNRGAEHEALRKYTCGANPIWGTVHMSTDLQMKGERDDSL